jgi:hypothetical protein
MRPISLFAMVGLLAACSAGSQWVNLTASPTSSPADAIACAKGRADTLGYQMTSLNTTDYRLTARKYDTSVHRADPRYRRNVDRLEVEAAPAADGKTSLHVIGRSFAEFDTPRGPTEEEERASADVRKTAQAIVDVCGAR